MKKNNDQLLRECIRTILVEQELNEDIMQGYGDSLTKVFLEPFKDAGTIIKGEISKLSTAMGVAVAGVADSVLSMLLPSYESKFKKIKDFEKKRLRELENDPDYKKAWSIIEPHVQSGTNKMAFLYDPMGFIAGTLVKKSPWAAWKASEVFLSDVPADKWYEWSKKKRPNRRDDDSWDKFIKRMRKDINVDTPAAEPRRSPAPSPTSTSGTSESFQRRKKKRRLTEAAATADDLIAFLESPEIKEAMMQSSLMTKIYDVTSVLAAESATMLADTVNKILNANSIEEIEEITGQEIDQSSLGISDTSTSTSNDPFDDNTEPDEGDEEVGEDQAVAAVLSQVKQKTREEVLKMLGDHLGEIGLGNEPDHPYYKTMMKAIESIVPVS